MQRKRPYARLIELKGESVPTVGERLWDQQLDRIAIALRRQPDHSRDKALIEAWLRDLTRMAKVVLQ
jgi:hypothetical protein